MPNFMSMRASNRVYIYMCAHLKRTHAIKTAHYSFHSVRTFAQFFPHYHRIIILLYSSIHTHANSQQDRKSLIFVSVSGSHLSKNHVCVRNYIIMFLSSS